jgi:hypothetical protein
MNKGEYRPAFVLAKHNDATSSMLERLWNGLSYTLLIWKYSLFSQREAGSKHETNALSIYDQPAASIHTMES